MKYIYIHINTNDITAPDDFIASLRIIDGTILINENKNVIKIDCPIRWFMQVIGVIYKFTRN